MQIRNLNHTARLNLKLSIKAVGGAVIMAFATAMFAFTGYTTPSTIPYIGILATIPVTLAFIDTAIERFECYRDYSQH